MPDNKSKPSVSSVSVMKKPVDTEMGSPATVTETPSFEVFEGARAARAARGRVRSGTIVEEGGREQRLRELNQRFLAFRLDDPSDARSGEPSASV
jgi:hypothetical protein